MILIQYKPYVLLVQATCTARTCTCTRLKPHICRLCKGGIAIGGVESDIPQSMAIFMFHDEMFFDVVEKILVK